MPKLLIEYKGIPGLLNHDIEKLKSIKFIVVYTTGKNDYTRKDFNDIESAIDFDPNGHTIKLIFIELKSEIFDGFYINIFQRFIKFTGKKFEFLEYAELENLNYYAVDFGLDSFMIIKGYDYVENYTRAKQKGGFYYERRATKIKGKLKEFELLNSFYELVPCFDDVYLETLFFLNIISKQDIEISRNEFEAYLLQAKLNYEMKIKQNKAKPKLQGKKEINKHVEKLVLSNLIGLSKIKLEIQELEALAQFRKKRIDIGLPVTPSTLHMVFTGNPGTGKTTVARLLGQIYYDIGLLSTNKVIEVSRGDLVGEYIGHTSPKTQKVFESALGGILFIDEAYSLFKTGKDFGLEAVETLLKLMEDNRENIVIIIAGYPKEMADLLNSNPGLKSRFSKVLNFEDYSKDELMQIFCNMVSDYKNQLSDGAKYKFECLIDKYYDSGYFNSNARTIRNIFEEIVKRQSHRLSKIDAPSHEQMIEFIDKDIPNNLK